MGQVTEGLADFVPEEILVTATKPVDNDPHGTLAEPKRSGGLGIRKAASEANPRKCYNNSGSGLRFRPRLQRWNEPDNPDSCSLRIARIATNIALIGVNSCGSQVVFRFVFQHELL